MKKATPSGAKARGRPLSFDRDTALEKAMHVFWQHGYEAASVSDLTAAMGISPPSLYAAFGDKERLFLECIERYSAGAGEATSCALVSEPMARDAIESLLRGAAEEMTKPCHPRGCMVVMAATNCSASSAHLQEALARRRAASEGNLRRRIEKGIHDGELPAATDAAALANFYATVLQGMSIHARDGASCESLLQTVEAAMRAWPAEPASAARTPPPERTRKRPRQPAQDG